MEENNKPQMICKECQMGRLSRRFVTYLTWLGDEIITVPDFPAWVCDVCGLRIYDGHALNRLSLLLSPNAGKSMMRTGPVLGTLSGEKPQPSQPN